MQKKNTINTANRDALYWTIYNNTKKKHPEWNVGQLHAVTRQLRVKVVQ